MTTDVAATERAVGGRWLPGLLAAVPLLAAGVRAVRSDWYPIGDNAFFALRARDVLTDHHPLLGTWTSASLTVGERLNNPGPLWFDVLALPARIDVARGVVVGVVLTQLAAVAIGVWWAGRIAGVDGAWAAGAAFLGLEWAMGSEILVDPWQPHSLLLPTLALLILVWAMVSGRAGAAPWVAGVGSLVLQTHLGYALLVPGLALLGVGGLVVPLVRDGGGSAAWATLRRPALATLVVFAVAWAQPVIDQLTGEGNLATVVTEGGSGEGPTVGSSTAARAVATVVAVPGGWGQRGFSGFRPDLEAPRPDHAAPPLDGLAAGATAAAWGLVAIAVGAVAGVGAWRRRDRTWGSALLVAGGAVVLVTVTIGRFPLSEERGLAAHQLRLVWPIAWFVLLAVAGTLLASRTARTARTIALASAAGLLLIIAMPAHNARSGPSDDAWSIPVVRELVDQLDAIEGPGPYLVDLSVLRFAEPYSTPVLLELQRRGVEVRVDDDIAIAQLGSSRALDPDEPVAGVLRIVDGSHATDPEPGWERVAYVPGLTRAEADELEALRAKGTLDAEETERLAELRRQRTFESAAVLLREAP